MKGIKNLNTFIKNGLFVQLQKYSIFIKFEMTVIYQIYVQFISDYYISVNVPK